MLEEWVNALEAKIRDLVTLGVIRNALAEREADEVKAADEAKAAADAKAQADKDTPPPPPPPTGARQGMFGGRADAPPQKV